jgi:DNA (cytosine-5)-methyltransferase 1
LTVKLGSLFDGAGTCPLAATMLGIEPVWASEIEPFPIKVTQSRFPHMTHLGDVTKVNGGDIEPVDIITFGSPCQNMSVAGKREGLEGKQSILFMDAIRIIKEMRNKTNGKYPRFAMWENVPGAYSSNKGEDFKIVLEEFVKIKEEGQSIPRPPKGKWQQSGLIMGDGYSIAWRTLDAQFWGVPQRRRRIFLVADFGGQCAREILFESEGLSRHFKESRETWEGIATNVKRSIREASGFDSYNQAIYEERSQTLKSHEGGDSIAKVVVAGFQGKAGAEASICYGENVAPSLVKSKEAMVCYGINPSILAIEPGALKRGQGERIWNKCPTLRANMGDNQPCVVLNDQGGNQMSFTEDVTATLRAQEHGNPPLIIEPRSQDGVCRIYENGIVPTLNTAQGGQRQPCVVFNEEVITSKTNNATDRHAVAYGGSSFAQYEENQVSTIKASGGDLGGGSETLIKQNYIVRRLTPTECAKLQGMPSWWSSDIAIEHPTEDDITFWLDVFDTYCKINETKSKSRKQVIRWLKKPYSDTAEYKMWGNGMALPCVLFVIDGIRRCIEK